MAEIAAEVGISRQAVSETLNRTDEKLRRYEKELGLIKKAHTLKAYADEIRTLTGKEHIDTEKLKDIADAIEEVI